MCHALEAIESNFGAMHHATHTEALPCSSRLLHHVMTFRAQIPNIDQGVITIYKSSSVQASTSQHGRFKALGQRMRIYSLGALALMDVSQPPMWLAR